MTIGYWSWNTYDPGIALNLEVVPPVHKRPKQIDFKNQLQITSFCTKVMLTIPQEQMTNEIEGLEKMSKLPPGQQLSLIHISEPTRPY